MSCKLLSFKKQINGVNVLENEKIKFEMFFSVTFFCGNFDNMVSNINCKTILQVLYSLYC